ncbi:type VI secretion-associated protein [Rhizobium phaseoli]|uniref:type VI secretion system-associated protein TagF n=1 Tax=Rhizobium phaseoli TaxID=396 RepID=UPI0003647EDA|nr:type VI secretion system-associated protein TagF [Rhizobium phaseoli]KKZ84301.1 type VI secretion protein, ImpM/SciT family [Rhizobium phaseoli Ch24-10]RDJ04358.1 type VI secretion-associated protein [Rhizobium phaseoli]RDJ06247.1 type VI secretion-associated protein [Rhizobium phaseoli]
MPDAALILPGFFGKLPAMGDFVTRRLPASFVGRWDRWISRHLVHRFSQGPMENAPVLRFLLGGETFGAMTGVILASADRAGRRFPLTIAAAPLLAAANIASGAADWFGQLEATGKSARDSKMDGDRLATCLTALPFPPIKVSDELVRGMIFWARGREAVKVDADAPETMLAPFFPGAEGDA